MGNNQSQQAAPPVQAEVVRRPPTRPEAPPTSRPISDLGPKGPSYHHPENMVLPKDIPMMKLRPVSMELMKYHPEYKEMFNHNDDDDDDDDGGDDKENMITDDEDAAKLEKLGTSPPRPPPPILKNANVPNGNAKPITTQVTSPTNQTANGHVGNGIGSSGLNNNNTAMNSNGKANVPYRPSHRRQISLGQEQHIIMEEPEEAIDSRVKLDPLMQSFPGATGPSLPVKNNFNLDYSYQLTYVQLAEHRRNKTIEDIEKRTGKKMSDLSADLNENQDQPFKRAAPSRISSKSTGSGGSALSSKKKRAPAPPGENGAPSAVGSSSTLPLPSKNKGNVQHQSYSAENEPPADYEMDSPRRDVNIVLPRYKAIPSNNNTGRSLGPPPPPAPPIALNGHPSSPRKSAPVSRNNSLSTGKPEIILKRTPSVTQADTNSADGEVPWLLQIKNLSKTMSARRQQSLEASSEAQDLSKDDSLDIEDEIKEKEASTYESISAAPQNRMIYETKTGNFEETTQVANGEMKDGENKIEEDSVSKGKGEKPASPKLARHASTIGFQEKHAPMIQRQISEPNSLASTNQTDPVRRLNSLLQHDIKATAIAKCHKVKKQITPVPAKPKDPHEVFREQLAKACAQRDERVKVEGTIDEKLKTETPTLGRVTDSPKDRKDSTTSSEPPEVQPKPPRYHKNISVNRNSSYDRRQNFQENRSSQALDWTPEVDLDSDDNLSDRETVITRKGASDGFKSTIVPKALSDLKAQKKSKKDKKPKGLEDENNRQKFGSVKKFKKSMQKSVKNAFGSISKASGRVLRKQKDEDLEHVEDAPKNWKLFHNDSRLANDHNSDRSKLYMVPNSHGDTDSDSEKVNSEDHEYTEVSTKQTMPADSTEDTSDDEESAEQLNVHRSKASNTAAKNISSPRDKSYNYDSKEEAAVAKYKEKKKKQQYRASVKEELEREQREASAIRAMQEARERERRLEAERRKQLEMELELHKIRETETRERLQRLENAHLQQQLNARLLQQQQQQQNISMQLSAPPLPAPAGNYNQSFPLGHQDPAQTQAAYTNLFGTPLPQNGYQNSNGFYHPSQTGPLLNGMVPGMTYDINDYMRMLGVQTPPNPQQVAYYLNSMNLTSHPYDRKSNPTIMDVINHQDPLKQYTTGHVNYQISDPSANRKQGFQSWGSAPNMNVAANATGSVPMSDFVASYSSLKGANNSQSETKDAPVKARNPLYNSDDSDDGLSPQRTVVRANVGDFRKLPARTESGKFMRQYGGNSYVSNTPDNGKSSNDNQSDVLLGNGLGKENMDSQYDGRVSPSNSTSTLDSAIASPSVSISSSSSPTRSIGTPGSPMVVQRSDENGFRTILDLTSANSKTQITMVDGSQQYS